MTRLEILADLILKALECPDPEEAEPKVEAEPPKRARRKPRGKKQATR